VDSILGFSDTIHKPGKDICFYIYYLNLPLGIYFVPRYGSNGRNWFIKTDSRLSALTRCSDKYPYYIWDTWVQISTRPIIFGILNGLVETHTTLHSVHGI
jgi:hypothetical protein